jgi:hypothetical protein
MRASRGRPSPHFAQAIRIGIESVQTVAGSGASDGTADAVVP